MCPEIQYQRDGASEAICKRKLPQTWMANTQPEKQNKQTNKINKDK
jgi:hypothetical protein